MDKLALAVEQLDRLRFPSDISFDREGGALAAAVRPASREPGESYAEPHLALRARRLGEPAHARAERRLSCRATRRSTAALPSPPTATIKGKADLLRARRRRGEAARRCSGHGRGSCAGPATAERSSCLPPIAASTAAPRTARSASRGATRRTPPSTTRRTRGGGSSGSMPRTGATEEVGPADLSVWEFDLLGDRRGGRARLGRPERARLVPRAPCPDRLRIAQRRRSCIASHWQLRAPAASPSGERDRLS